MSLLLYHSLISDLLQLLCCFHELVTNSYLRFIHNHEEWWKLIRSRISWTLWFSTVFLTVRKNFPICWSTLKTSVLENSRRSMLHISKTGKGYFQFQIEFEIKYLFNLFPAPQQPNSLPCCATLHSRSNTVKVNTAFVANSLSTFVYH